MTTSYAVRVFLRTTVAELSGTREKHRAQATVTVARLVRTSDGDRPVDVLTRCILYVTSLSLDQISQSDQNSQQQDALDTMTTQKPRAAGVRCGEENNVYEHAAMW